MGCLDDRFVVNICAPIGSTSNYLKIQMKASIIHILWVHNVYHMICKHVHGHSGPTSSVGMFPGRFIICCQKVCVTLNSSLMHNMIYFAMNVSMLTGLLRAQTSQIRYATLKIYSDNKPRPPSSNCRTPRRWSFAAQGST